MPTVQLSNTAAQINQTLSEHYTRLVGNYVGPLVASSSPASGFIIQNGNRGNGICVANNGTTFFNNNLYFNPSDTDLRIDIPDTRQFIVTGNGAVMNFNGNGTFSVGQDIDLNYKGLQVYNSTPGLLLRDRDSFGGSGSQFLYFADAGGWIHSRICYGRDTFFSGNNVTSANQNTLTLDYSGNFKISDNLNPLMIARCNRVSFFANNEFSSGFNFFIKGNALISCNLQVSGIQSNSGICSNSILNIQSGSGVSVGSLNLQFNTGFSQFLNFGNSGSYVHSSITSNQGSNGGSSICFLNTSIGQFNQTRTGVAALIDENKKLTIYGDTSAETACYLNLCAINSFRNNGSQTFIGKDVNNLHTFQSASVSVADGALGRGRYYCAIFNNGSCAVGHEWNLMTGIGFAPLVYNGSGLRSPLLISSLSGITSSGNLLVNNTSQFSCINQNAIHLIGNSTTGPAITLSGLTCLSGILRSSQVICAANFCSTGVAINCFDTIVGKCLYLDQKFVISPLQNCINANFCAANILSYGNVFGFSFSQAPQATSPSYFKTDVFVGAGFDTANNIGVIHAKNTVKSWGTACIKNGWVTNGYSAATPNFHNVSLMYNAPAFGQGTFSIVFKQPIISPFSATFSVRAINQFPWTTGSGSFNNNINFYSTNGDGILPLSAHLLECGFNSTFNRYERFVNGQSYSALLFTVADNNLYGTNWWTQVGAQDTNIPNLNIFTNTAFPQLVNLSPVYRGNYIKGIVDFSINSLG